MICLQIIFLINRVIMFIKYQKTVKKSIHDDSKCGFIQQPNSPNPKAIVYYDVYLTDWKEHFCMKYYLKSLSK